MLLVHTIFERNPNIQTLPRGETKSPSFSWSSRFDKDLPIPSDDYSAAQRNNQYRHYYGYHPSDASTAPASRMYPPALRELELTRVGSRKPIYQPCPAPQPASLPSTVQSVTNKLLAFELNSRSAGRPGNLHSSGALSLPFNNRTVGKLTNYPSYLGKGGI